MTNEIYCAIALSYLPGVGPIRARRMLSHAGSFAAALKLDEHTLKQLQIPAKAVEHLADGTALRKADGELKFIEQNNIQVIDVLDERYPRRMGELLDAPLVLYYNGSTTLDPKRTVGIVGTRSPTSYGLSFCETLVDELTSYGVTVISGLAYGIDIAAQEACVRTNTPTIGVVAHGLGEVYPAAHRSTALQMMRNGGLLTEYPSGMRSRREYFPQRNRIIAALSDAVVVVESAARGGSMITANLALGYNTPVFALPGRVRDKTSAGCNDLIKNNRAHLIESAADIGYILGWQPGDTGAPTGRANLLFQSFTPVEQEIIDQLQSADDLDVDELLSRLDVSSGQLAALLLELEFKGVVKSLPGKRFTLT